MSGQNDWSDTSSDLEWLPEEEEKALSDDTEQENQEEGADEIKQRARFTPVNRRQRQRRAKFTPVNQRRTRHSRDQKLKMVIWLREHGHVFLHLI